MFLFSTGRLLQNGGMPWMRAVCNSRLNLTLSYLLQPASSLSHSFDQMEYPKTKSNLNKNIPKSKSYLSQPAVFLPRRSRLSCQRFPTTTQLRRAHKRLRGSAGLQSLPAQHQQNASVSIWQLRWGLFHNRNAQLQCTSERSSSSCKLSKV